MEQTSQCCKYSALAGAIEAEYGDGGLSREGSLARGPAQPRPVTSLPSPQTPTLLKQQLHDSEPEQDKCVFVSQMLRLHTT